MPKINLEPTNIISIIEEVVELYSNLKEIELFTSFNADIPEIEIDKKQIKMALIISALHEAGGRSDAVRQALINLIDNAIQSKTDKIRLNAYYNSVLDMIRIEVTDEGIGIKEEDKDKLFFPYFSTKKEGTGLGLAIVNSIISKHRGYIRVQDNKPKGTQFIIELPIGQK